MISPSLHPETITAGFVRRRRLSFALTPRAIILLVAGFLWLIPGFWFSHIAYGMAIWDGIVLLVALFDVLRLPRASTLKASRSWSNAPTLDGETELELSIEHQGKIILFCLVVDDLPPALVSLPATYRLTAYPRVPGTLRYRVQPQERGDWETGSLYIRYRSFFGLTERWAVAPLKQTVRVYPAMRTGEEQNIYIARSRQIELQLRKTAQRGLGRDFESLREYLHGDDLRDICWTATARRGTPITRRYQTERSQSVWIVLDCGRLMRSRVAGAPEKPSALPDSASTEKHVHSKLDHACSSAIALAQLALYSGDRVGLLAYGQNIQQRLLPGRGATHLRQLMESLAQVRAETSEADHLRATAILSRLQPRRALILWVTDMAETAMRPEVIDGAMQLLRRHALLFVAMAQPEVESIADKKPETIDQMYLSAAAREMAARRELLLAQLHEQGALTLDLSPDTLTSAILNHYLTVKERAMV